MERKFLNVQVGTIVHYHDYVFDVVWDDMEYVVLRNRMTRKEYKVVYEFLNQRDVCLSLPIILVETVRGYNPRYVTMQITGRRDWYRLLDTSRENGRGF